MEEHSLLEIFLYSAISVTDLLLLIYSVFSLSYFADSIDTLRNQA